jgi:hypothetical protein
VGVNIDKRDKWEEDTALSVKQYNEWFITSAPTIHHEERFKAEEKIRFAFETTNNLTNITREILRENPEIIHVLRMCTSPPFARDRLIGLGQIDKNLIHKMEKNKLPPSLEGEQLDIELGKIINILKKYFDKELFNWIDGVKAPTHSEIETAILIIADRLSNINADTIIRNRQEERQSNKIIDFLTPLGYRRATNEERKDWINLPNGTYSIRILTSGLNERREDVKIPIDILIKPFNNDKPLLIELKAAGDFTNTNKRQKEEAKKMTQLTLKYKDRIRYILFLCGYFNDTYLGYEAADNIDWVWEHRIEDLRKFGV